MTNYSSDQSDKTELQLEHKADVLIVGGGPIGLVQAWGLKKLNPDLKVVVLEKYEEFQRKHTLVMQYKQLEALMRATDSMEDPVLRSLLQQLRKSPNIRTNILQETFKNLATALGVEIKIQEVKADNIADQIQKYSPELIIGADGTHSVVNEQLFPKGNRINYEIDYAMQVRLEIDGDADKSLDQTIQFYQ
jgi:2-polyprenyl-6-methoxyphenol hydroxylase-like FAD-dependent oxidoreductase